MGIMLLLLAACALPVQTVTFKGSRTERFLYGVAYYQKLSGDNHRLVFEEKEYPGHPDYCAWVVRDPDLGIVIGLNKGNPRCLEFKPEWLSLHEVCHLRMQHTSSPFDVSMPPDQKEREVAECMKGYDARREK